MIFTSALVRAILSKRPLYQDPGGSAQTHLGRGVVNGSDASLQSLPRVKKTAQAKVDHPNIADVPLVLEKEVFRFEVAVDDLYRKRGLMV